MYIFSCLITLKFRISVPVRFFFCLSFSDRYVASEGTSIYLVNNKKRYVYFERYYYWVIFVLHNFSGGYVYLGGYVYYFIGIIPGGMFIPGGTPILKFRV